MLYPMALTFARSLKPQRRKGARTLIVLNGTYSKPHSLTVVNAHECKVCQKAPSSERSCEELGALARPADFGSAYGQP